MRHILFLLLLLPLLVLAQSDLPAEGLSKAGKGISPITGTAGAGLRPVTYAVVVGISDYQDKDIPDLRFADRDAEAFANFLRSPAESADQ
ncbi:MAG: hypothetical protein Q7T20_18030 [Saprospiraceae bacterium]|nr:hypothetical protein [Saprospiraceae bacterium]